VVLRPGWVYNTETLAGALVYRLCFEDRSKRRINRRLVLVDKYCVSMYLQINICVSSI
jgi:hypothetical protein